MKNCLKIIPIFLFFFFQGNAELDTKTQYFIGSFLGTLFKVEITQPETVMGKCQFTESIFQTKIS